MAIKLPIYMDNHATTPVDPRVLEAMLPYFTQKFGNAASRNHAFGWAGEEAVETARQQIASSDQRHAQRNHFHQRRDGIRQPDDQGHRGNVPRKGQSHHHPGHRAQSRSRHLQAPGKVRLRSDLSARRQRRPRRSRGCAQSHHAEDNSDHHHVRQQRNRRRQSHRRNRQDRQGTAASSSTSDGVQAVGKIPVDVQKDNIDLLAITGHKIYGPKGVGALYVRRRNPRVQLSAIDRRRRPRTRHALRHAERSRHRGTRQSLRDLPRRKWPKSQCACARCAIACETGLKPSSTKSIVNGSWDHRLPNNLNMSFAYVEGESLLMGINDIAVSSGSACTSATLEPSYVLKALGVGEDLAHTSIRFGLGRFNTQEEVDYVIDKHGGGRHQTARAVPALRNGQGRHRSEPSEWAGALCRRQHRERRSEPWHIPKR